MCGPASRKIHLDCSEGCAGEPAQLDDATAAGRAAILARACAEATKDPESLVLVIGTEVPPPGGARLDDAGQVIATTPQGARQTLKAHRDAFDKAGIGSLWGRVAGLVVQPGVEFSPTHVHPLPAARDPGLKGALADYPGICLEAHSTDYQRPEVYRRLAALGFAFHKVGPALTFAWRRVLYALDQVRAVLEPGSARLADVVEREMRAEPGHWQRHYPADDVAQRHFSYADRIRYYWANPRIATAVAELLAAIDALDPGDYVVAQVLDPEVIARAPDLADSRALSLARAQVQCALAPYFLGAPHG